MSITIEDLNDLDKLEHYYKEYKEYFELSINDILFKIFELKKTVKTGVVGVDTAFDAAAMYALQRMQFCSKEADKLDISLFGSSDLNNQEDE